MIVTILFCLFQYTIPTTGTNTTDILLSKAPNATSLLSKIQNVFGKINLKTSEREWNDESLGIETYTAIVICITLSILLKIAFFCYYFSCIHRCSLMKKKYLNFE